MKKNKMMRIASVLLVAVLLSTCVISGTFAKYTSSANGTDTATVAKWDVSVEDVKLGSTAKNFTFDIFGDKLAPGMSGTFELDITNNSEVNAVYSLDFTVTNASNVPIQFSTDGTTYSNDLTDVTDQTLSSGANKVTIYWKWNTTSDAADTEFGIKDTLDTVKVDVVVTVSQSV